MGRGSTHFLFRIPRKNREEEGSEDGGSNLAQQQQGGGGRRRKSGSSLSFATQQVNLSFITNNTQLSLSIKMKMMEKKEKHFKLKRAQQAEKWLVTSENPTSIKYYDPHRGALVLLPNGIKMKFCEKPASTHYFFFGGLTCQGTRFEPLPPFLYFFILSY